MGIKQTNKKPKEQNLFCKEDFTR